MRVSFAWIGAATLAACSGCARIPPEREFIAARGAIGPYSGSVIAGDLCFVSGKIAPDQAAGGEFAREVAAVIDAIEDELEATTLALGDVVSVTAYLTDMSLFAEFNRVYAQRFQQPYPARTTVGVDSLPARRRIEMTVIALRRDG